MCRWLDLDLLGFKKKIVVFFYVKLLVIFDSFNDRIKNHKENSQIFASSDSNWCIIWKHQLIRYSKLVSSIILSIRYQYSVASDQIDRKQVWNSSSKFVFQIVSYTYEIDKRPVWNKPCAFRSLIFKFLDFFKLRVKFRFPLSLNSNNWTRLVQFLIIIFFLRKLDGI